MWLLFSTSLEDKVVPGRVSLRIANPWGLGWWNPSRNRVEVCWAPPNRDLIKQIPWGCRRKKESDEGVAAPRQALRKKRCGGDSARLLLSVGADQSQPPF